MISIQDAHFILGFLIFKFNSLFLWTIGHYFFENIQSVGFLTSFCLKTVDQAK